MANADFPVIQGTVIAAALLVAVASRRGRRRARLAGPERGPRPARRRDARGRPAGAQLVLGRRRSARRGGGTANVQSGHSVALRPVSSRYQLLQPVLQTVSLHPLVDRAVVAPRRPRAGPPRPRRRGARIVAQRVHHVGHLGLDHVDHRAVPEPGVRAEQHEQVREAGDGACRGGRAGCPPSTRRACGRRGRGRSRATGMSVTWKPVPKMIASTSMLLARLGDDRVLADLGDAVGDELDVVAAERRIPLVRGQDPLAADRVARLDLARAARGRRSGGPCACGRAARRPSSASAA